jgi:hypothetical protein
MTIGKPASLHDIEQVLTSCLGLDIESVSSQPSAVPGADVTITVNAIQRSPHDIRITYSVPESAGSSREENVSLPPHQLVSTNVTVRLHAERETSQPYWLLKPHSLGRYEVADLEHIGTPENPPALPVVVDLSIDGYPIRYTIPTAYKYNDPVRGEVKEPFVLTPPAMVNLPESPLIFSDTEPLALPRVSLPKPV